MEEVLYSFEPTKVYFNNTTLISLGVAFAAIVFAYFYLKKKVPYYRKKEQQLISLLLSFLIVIALGTSFFSWLASTQLKTVQLSKEKLETPFGIAKLKNISSVYIYLDQQKSSLSSRIVKDSTRLLIIEETDRKTHALSEENYEIDKILSRLEELLKE